MKKIRRENKLIKELIDQYGVKTTDDIKDMLKDLLGETIQTMLEGEIEEELGYSKYNYEEKDTQNSRNGYSPKSRTILYLHALSDAGLKRTLSCHTKL